MPMSMRLASRIARRVRVLVVRIMEMPMLVLQGLDAAGKRRGRRKPLLVAERSDQTLAAQPKSA